jgi:hypothetical protein
MTTEKPKPPKLTAADKAFRRQVACAVLTGIYAAHGCDIMEADRAEYELAIRTARRVAYEQADEMLRGEA